MHRSPLDTERHPAVRARLAPGYTRDRGSPRKLRHSRTFERAWRRRPPRHRLLYRRRRAPRWVRSTASTLPRHRSPGGGKTRRDLAPDRQFGQTEGTAALLPRLPDNQGIANRTSLESRLDRKVPGLRCAWQVGIKAYGRLSLRAGSRVGPGYSGQVDSGRGRIDHRQAPAGRVCTLPALGVHRLRGRPVTARKLTGYAPGASYRHPFPSERKG